MTSLQSALAARGFSTSGYDFLISINVDPSKAEGGVAYTCTTPAFIYVGNYFSYKSRLDESQLYNFAATAYHHEVAHHLGWPATHDWSPTCGATRLGFEPLITAPILFGWEDTDGDGVPEILDSTPYGRSR